MTGRTNANTASVKAKSPVQSTETRKPGRPKSNQLNNSGKLPKDTEKKLLNQSIGLKEAIDSARRSFEKGFKFQKGNRNCEYTERGRKTEKKRKNVSAGIKYGKDLKKNRTWSLRWPRI